MIDNPFFFLLYANVNVNVLVSCLMLMFKGILS